MQGWLNGIQLKFKKTHIVLWMMYTKWVMDKEYNGQCITISKNTMMVWQKRTWDLPSFGNKSRQQQGTIARKWRCNSR